MSINSQPNAITLIYSILESDKFLTLKESRKQFIANVLLLFLSIKGRINFLQLDYVNQTMYLGYPIQNTGNLSISVKNLYKLKAKVRIITKRNSGIKFD